MCNADCCSCNSPERKVERLMRKAGNCKGCGRQNIIVDFNNRCQNCREARI
jgi:hypothetical protein